MTAEQLEELQRLINRAKDFADQAKGHDAPLFEGELRKMADAMDHLARRVIAAEMLVEAANNLVGHDEWGTVNYTDNAMWKDGDLLKAAITAYREASKG